MRNGKKIFGLMFLVIGILSIGVSAQTKIGGMRWQLIELNGKPVSNSRIYLEFDEAAKRISGNAGCNRFFGGYERKGQSFNVKGVGSTRMACMKPGVMETESAFLKAVNDATRLQKNGDTLSLFKGRSPAVRFKVQARSGNWPASELTSPKWILTKIADKPVTLVKGSAHIIFNGDKGTAGGNGGCNSFGGNYEVEGSQIKFEDLISTLMACAEERMEIEHSLFDGLRSADRFEIKNGRLFMYKGATLLLEFEGTANRFGKNSNGNGGFPSRQFSGYRRRQHLVSSSRTHSRSAQVTGYWHVSTSL